MIIQCDKCETRFRLDDSRITGNGVKVRCTKCQNVFIVAPPPPAEEVELNEVFGAGGSSPSTSSPSFDDGAKREPSREKAPARPREENKRNLAFDFDENTVGDAKARAPETGSSPAEEPFAGEENTGDEKLSFNDIDFSFGEERTEEREKEEGWDAGEAFGFDAEGTDDTPKKDEPDFSFDDPVDKGDDDLRPTGFDAVEDPVEPPKEAAPYSASGYTRAGKAAAAPESPVVKEASAAPGEEFKDIISRSLTKEELPAFDEPEEEHKPTRGQFPGRLAPILAVLIVLLGGAVIYYSGVIDKLARALMPPAASTLKTVEIENISGFFAENRNFGKFFVIQARVKNITGEPQEIKAATGVIYDEDGNTIGSRSVSPGRMVSTDDLKNLPKEELIKAFKDPSGGVIPAKGTVPVMVLFTDIAEGVTEYGIDIVR